MLQILANQAAATLSLIREREQQRQLAVRDGLTGLYNRRAFNELLERAIAAEDRREGGQLGLVLLDIDHFKKLNDTYGHQAGDAALVSLAGLLRDHPRRGDQAARYGGEEFVVILPDLDAERSLQAAERLRQAIEKHRFVYDGGRIRITASLGVAVWPGDGKDAEALLERRRPQPLRRERAGPQSRRGGLEPVVGGDADGSLASTAADASARLARPRYARMHPHARSLTRGRRDFPLTADPATITTKVPLEPRQDLTAVVEWAETLQSPPGESRGDRKRRGKGRDEECRDDRRA